MFLPSTAFLTTINVLRHPKYVHHMQEKGSCWGRNYCERMKQTIREQNLIIIRESGPHEVVSASHFLPLHHQSWRDFSHKGLRTDTKVMSCGELAQEMGLRFWPLTMTQHWYSHSTCTFRQWTTAYISFSF